MESSSRSIDDEGELRREERGERGKGQKRENKFKKKKEKRKNERAKHECTSCLSQCKGLGKK